MASNLVEMRNELFEVFNGLRDGTVDVKDAVEINNTAGKITNTVKVQLAYFSLRKESPYISALAGEVEPSAEAK